MSEQSESSGRRRRRKRWIIEIESNESTVMRPLRRRPERPRSGPPPGRSTPCRRPSGERPSCDSRSEEHTYELQSLMRISYAVFCLKKKTKLSATKQLEDDMQRS